MRHLTILVPAVAAAAMLVGAAPAQAAGTDTTAEHCVMNLSSGATACRTSMDDALAATDGRAAAVYSLATVYQNTNYGGSSLTFTGSHECTVPYEDWEYVVDDLGTIDFPGWGTGSWSNKVSSVHTYSKCDVRFYDWSDQRTDGGYSNFIDNSADLHALGWGDRATSMRFS